ncbi:MAG: PEP-CTERM system histidine kinase PrsK [Geminicoccaceae bacterium]|nr:PEP-CTERM system histidine kinase PrsK [Geminicoccaceae bacterium]
MLSPIDPPGPLLLVAVAGGVLQLIGFSGLLALLIHSWGRAHVPALHGRLLMSAVAAAALSGATFAMASAGWIDPAWAGAAALLATIGWCIFLLLIAGVAGARSVTAVPLWVWPLIAGLALVHLIDTTFGAWLHLAFSVVSLLLVERTYRLADDDRRWALKFMLVGLGAIFAFDAVALADVLFTGGTSSAIAARGWVQALVVPLAAASIARNPSWAFDIHVARRAVVGGVFVGATLVYVLATWLVGLGLVDRLGELGGAARAFLVTLLLGLLALSLMSGTVKGAVALLVSRTFFSYRFDYRREWARFIETLGGRSDHAAHGLAERVIFAVADLVDATGGAIWRYEGDGHFRPVAVRNLPFHECHAGQSRPLAARLTETDRPIECGGSEPFGAWPSWMPDPGLCWLVLPLTHRGRLFGAMVLARARVPRALDLEESELLHMAAREAASYLAEDEAAERLRAAAAFATFNRRFAFVMHDVKNIAAQLSMTLANAARHRDDPAFQADMLVTLRRSVERMETLIDRIKKSDKGQQGVLRLDLLLRDLAEEDVALHGFDAPVQVRGDADAVRMAVAHLIDNARESAPGRRRVELVLDRCDGMAVIEVRDDGAGMDAAFVKLGLFRPFATTKKTGTGLGMLQVEEAARATGGRVEVESAPGRGSIVRMLLPLLGEPVA